MKILMLKTMLGSPDGITVNEYEQGGEYDVPAGLADNFLGQGCAQPVKDKPVKAPEKKPAAPPEKKPASK